MKFSVFLVIRLYTGVSPKCVMKCQDDTGRRPYHNVESHHPTCNDKTRFNPSMYTTLPSFMLLIKVVLILKDKFLQSWRSDIKYSSKGFYNSLLATSSITLNRRKALANERSSFISAYYY